MLFVENLDKVVKTKSSEPVQLLGSQKLEALQSENRSITTGATSEGKSVGQQQVAERSAYDSNGEEEANDSDEESTKGGEVLLNISPKKYEKPKDQLFIDFFSMYTKQFVKDQGKHSASSSQKKPVLKLEGKTLKATHHE